MRFCMLILGTAGLLTAGAIAQAEQVDPAQALAQKFAEDGAPKPPRPSLDYEMEMLKRARAEEAARQSVGTAPASNPPAPVTAPAAPVAKQGPLVVRPPATPAAATPLPATPAAAPPATKPPAPSPAPSQEAKADPKPPEATVPATASTTAVATAPRATILLVLDTKSPASSAQFEHVKDLPDPIVCLGDACALSSGFETAARMMPRTEAIKLKSTNDAKAGSCEGKTACVFRDVPVPPGVALRVVDLSSAGHDHHDVIEVKADASCKVADGELECDEPTASPDYRIWLVPEATARTAGPDALEDALAQGLPQEDMTRTSDK